MSDKDVFEFLVQSLYEKLLDKMFTFTINNKCVTSAEFFSYPISTAFIDNKSLLDKAKETRLNVSHDTLRGNYEFKL